MVVAAFGKALATGDTSGALALLHPDVVIFEGGGWETLEDYRKGHLRADINAMQSLKQETLRDVIKVSGDLALSTREYSTTGQRGERAIDNVGAESMVLLRTSTGWKIRHIHWSSRARRRTNGNIGPGADCSTDVGSEAPHAIDGDAAILRDEQPRLVPVAAIGAQPFNVRAL
jgi:ketosteroid isomerase-like protein